MKRKKILFIFVLMLFVLIPCSVKAEDVQYNLCFPDAGAFRVTFDSEVATEVSKDKITLKAVEEGHLPYPEGITDEEKVKYQFSAARFAYSCYEMNNGDVSSCPNNKQVAKYDYVAKLVESSSKYITFTLNTSTGKFNIKIKDPYNGELYYRYVYGSRENNEFGFDSSYYAGQFLERNDGYYTINNVNDNSNLRIELYIKTTGECSGAYVGSFGINVPSNYEYEIDNPAISRPNYYGCDVLFNFNPEGMSTEEKNNEFEPAKKKFVSECYNKKITYGELSSLKSNITSKVNAFKSMFSNYTPSASDGEVICDEKSTGDTYTYNYLDNKYWAMTCTETYTANGDVPKLVKAGSGFEYQTNYTVTRKCDIYSISTPVKKPQCSYSGGNTCYWVGKNTGLVFHGKDAGPTEDFDNCVYECDGGNYSQSCINSCYSKVYGNERDLGFTDKFSYSFNTKSNVARTAYHSWRVTGADANAGSCTTDHFDRFCQNGICFESGGNPGKRYVFTKGNMTISFCISDSCASGANNYCDVWYTSTPDGCSDNAEAEYQAALAQAQNEYNELKRLQLEMVAAGEYEFQITDSYLKTENGKPYVYKVNSTVDPMVNVEQNQQVIARDGNSVTVKSDIVVSLPLSYVEKVNGNVVYTSNKEATTAFGIDHKKSKFNRVDFDINRYYHTDGERKYYTNIFADDLNIVVKDNKIQLVRTSDYNIKVVSSKVGKGQFGTDILCYYGVYNQFYGKDDCDPDKEICDGGIQWIYRPIELTDVFPNNRSPRWNWTGTLNSSNHTYTGAARFSDQTSLRYNIDPVRLTENIESKGNAIFDVQKDASEVDYEFVLTKENLDNIRKYNKNVNDYNGDGYNNYADYNMNCYKDGSGKEICTSRFLDNINANSGTESASNFITYSVSGFTIDARKNIAGCNNSKSGACSEIDG